MLTVTPASISNPYFSCDNMKASILFFSCLFLATAANAQDSKLQPYLPKGAEVIGEVSYLGAEPEVEKISQRFTAAVQANQAWFQEYVQKQNVKPGEPLPYDPKMGISKDEYDTFLSSKGKLKLVKIGEIKLRFEPNADGVTIHSTGMQIALDGFEINTAKNYVKTHLSTLETAANIDQKDANSPTGRWFGSQWKRIAIKNNPDGVIVEKLAIGRRRDDAKGIIYYDLKSAEPQASTHFVVLYPLD